MTHIFELDELKFGNPTLRQKNSLEQSSFLDNLFDDFSQVHYPLNTSSETKNELNEISERISAIATPENEKHLKRYVAINQNLFQFLVNNIPGSSKEKIDLLSNLNNDISPLITRLQFHHQRPTPKMLAVYYKLKLFPLVSPKQELPTYPNKDVVLTFLASEILISYKPDDIEIINSVREYVLASLTYMGIAYISDISFSVEVAETILRNPEFTKKYKI
jgi:hypothetical protein